MTSFSLKLSDMQLNNFAKLNIPKSDLSFIDKSKEVVLLANVAKKLTSTLLMLVFTVVGFLVLAVSVVIVTVESLVSALLSQAKSSKKDNLQDLGSVQK